MLELDAFASDGQPVIENLVNDSPQTWKFIDGDWFMVKISLTSSADALKSA
ncbi:MAG: hypothetical protein Ct9H300mP11_18140 [Chloroflexota bacterium]|nr:MAG: hypothetical protein Ct9H300mP11_18140 [Chloroflexota bacterium]